MAQPVCVLLVEDNPADAELTRDALIESRLHIDFQVVGDGEQALSYLRREGQHSAAPIPDLVILDLNLPRVDGREVLAEMKKDAKLKLIPVVVLTSSQADEDILASYSLGANCYVKKPLDLAAFQKIVNAVKEFWFTIVKLPNTGIISGG